MKRKMKIAIIGYGKMGHMIEDVARSRGHEIVARIDVGDAFDLKDADVAIEFTTPATAKDNILRAWAQGVPVVCGTTGWKPEELKGEGFELKEVDSKKLIVESKTGKVMLVWSSNYSVGVNIFFELNKFLAEQMKNLTPSLSQGEGEKSEGYTPSIKEIHHIHKLDKPSGTAKTLAEQIRETDLSRYRNIEDIEIESVREGEVPGTHEVTWDSEEDTIVITHIAKGRRGFALGAVLAAEKIVG